MPGGHVLAAVKTLLQSRRVRIVAAATAVGSALSALALNQALGRLVFVVPEGEAPPQIVVADTPSAPDAEPADNVGDGGTEDGGDPVAQLPTPAGAGGPVVLPKSSYADPILRRSLFDSSKVGVTPQSDASGVGQSELRYTLLATVVADPDVYSSALMTRDDQGTRSQGYGIGDTLEGGEGKVVRIEPKRVYIERPDGSTEFLEIGGKKSGGGSSAPTEPAADDESGVTKEGDNKFVIERRVVDEAMQNLDALATKIRVVPHKGPDGEIDGYRMSAIRRGSLFDKLGIKNGDIVHAVNGMALTSPDAGLSAFQTLQSSSNFTFEVTRRNKRQTFEYEIR